MLLIVLVSAVVNAGLGFALAVYLERRYHALVIGGEPGGIAPYAGDSAASPPPATETASPGQQGSVAQSVEGLQTRVQQYNQQSAGAAAQPNSTEAGAEGSGGALDQAAASDLVAAGKSGK
jgi:hypothetical protein